MIHSDDEEPFSLNGLILRYYYTRDADQPQGSACWDPPGVCPNVSISFYPYSATNASQYLELNLENVDTVLNSGDNWTINIGFHNEDFSPYTFANDYSYSQSASFVENDRITLYADGGATLIWGEEP